MHQCRSHLCDSNPVAMLYHIMLYHTIPYHTMPYHTIPYHAKPYHTVGLLPSTQPVATLGYHTLPYDTIPYDPFPHANSLGVTSLPARWVPHTNLQGSTLSAPHSCLSTHSLFTDTPLPQQCHVSDYAQHERGCDDDHPH